MLSISQLCDKGYWVLFYSLYCFIESKNDRQIKFIGHRINNVYMINLKDIPPNHAHCLMSKENDSWLWHRRIAHIHMDHLNKLVSKDLVIGLPKLKFEKNK